LQRRFLSSEVINIDGNHWNARSQQKFQETVRAMKRGVPIIYSGVLHSPRLKYYGVPDLIVRSDYLEKIVSYFPKDNTLDFSAFWSTSGSSGEARNYHYRIVDMKWSTLLLRADGEHLLNAERFPAYKAQLWIYNEILSEIQEYHAPKAYLIGRKFKYTSKGIQYKGNHSFDRYGVINFLTVDEDIAMKVQEGVEWVRAVRREGAGWNTIRYPLSRKELYPNMSNHSDWPWHGVKEYLSTRNGDITALWMCGVKQRDCAASHGIYSWTDPRCTVDTLGVDGPMVRPLLQKILQINQPLPDSKELVDPLLAVVDVYPPFIKNNMGGWKTPREIEYFVDFETINDVFDGMETLPASPESPCLIFMIGVGWTEAGNPGVWNYKSFIVNSFTKEEEQRICKDFVNFVRGMTPEGSSLYHWSPAENHVWESSTAGGEEGNQSSNVWSRRCNRDDYLFIERQWFDLLRLFKNPQEPIVIRGALGFGLKDITKALYNHGYISKTWGESGCQSGQQAMFLAKKASDKAIATGIPLSNTQEMMEIRKYNEIDCRVLWEILSYLRKFHCC
jgi:hypothetical protein